MLSESVVAQKGNERRGSEKGTRGSVYRHTDETLFQGIEKGHAATTRSRETVRKKEIFGKQAWLPESGIHLHDQTECTSRYMLD
jgi:hypothetical protein